MRYALIGFSLLHAFAHLPGFLGSAEMPPAPNRALRLMWLGLAVSFAILAWGVWQRAPWWLAAVVPLALLSTAACFTAWPAARMGLLANGLVLVLAALAVGYASALPVRHPLLEELWRSPGDAVRLHMRGEIKLGGRWWPFRGEQVIHARRGMVWSAALNLYGLPVRGADALVDGAGRMEWKIFDLVPVAKAEGPDITRSAQGRLNGETEAWLYPERRAPGPIVFPRWGNPEGGAFRQEMFGVLVDEERVFEGRKIPSKIRAGWYAGTPRFESEGEFFRAVIERAEYKK